MASVLNDIPADFMDSSAASMSDAEFRDYILAKTQEVLNKYFPTNAAKRKIRIHKDYLQFACPLCGDSARDNTKKRGSIILTGQYKYRYKCHNCGETMTLSQFFKKLKCDDLNMSAAEYIALNRDNYGTFRENEIKAKNLLFDVDYIESICPDRETFKRQMLVSECNGTYGSSYLMNRGIWDFNRFLYNTHNNTLYVLNLTPSGRVFGFQVRNLSNNPNIPKYKSYNIENIRKFVCGDSVVDEKVTQYNTLSMTFNVLNINYERPIIVTEGPMDSFFLKNSIAMCGASKSLVLDLDFYYLYDSDKTGKDHAIEKLSGRRNVFLWDKFIRENGVERRKKWDWNDIVLYFRANNKTLPNPLSYFSSDPMDMFEI